MRGVAATDGDVGDDGNTKVSPAQDSRFHDRDPDGRPVVTTVAIQGYSLSAGQVYSRAAAVRRPDADSTEDDGAV
jgi:hypothetical protein